MIYYWHKGANNFQLNNAKQHSHDNNNNNNNYKTAQAKQKVPFLYTQIKSQITHHDS